MIDEPDDYNAWPQSEQDALANTRANDLTIALAEQFIARRLAVECLEYMKGLRGKGLDTDDQAERTNVHLRMLLNEEMVRHDVAVEEALHKILKTSMEAVKAKA